MDSVSFASAEVDSSVIGESKNLLAELCTSSLFIYSKMRTRIFVRKENRPIPFAYVLKKAGLMSSSCRSRKRWTPAYIRYRIYSRKTMFKVKANEDIAVLPGSLEVRSIETIAE